MNLYNYEAKILRIVDGDTVNLEIDMGMKIYFKTNCRLSGVDAPPLRSLDPIIKANAIKAKDYLAFLLPIDSIVNLASNSLDKYGRSLAKLTTKEGVIINDEMLRSGNAIAYSK